MLVINRNSLTGLYSTFEWNFLIFFLIFDCFPNILFYILYVYVAFLWDEYKLTKTNIHLFCKNNGRKALRLHVRSRVNSLRSSWFGIFYSVNLLYQPLNLRTLRLKLFFCIVNSWRRILTSNVVLDGTWLISRLQNTLPVYETIKEDRFLISYRFFKSLHE